MTSTTSIPTYTAAWSSGYDGTRFYTRTYTASSPRAVVLFVHGFAEHIARYEWAHGVYASKGITVFTYDQRGFGRTALDKDKKSKDSAYAKTSWHDQFSDIEFWLKHLKKEYPELPLFLMGHSMGGGLVLGFATRTIPAPEKETLSLLSGVVASSPLILQTTPASRMARFVGGKLSGVLPSLLIPAPIPVEDLSHDSVANALNTNDPWIIQKGSLKGLHDMLSGGEQLLWSNYKHWPRDLPLFIVHGDADKVTSFKASREFFGKVDAVDKEFKPFEGGFHELIHEPEGVKEKFVDECILWIVKHVESSGRRSPISGAKL
ncbi:lysophospholipase [Fomes fomentarius]|nr:lysophospholipase [Fomes fomentarius]